MDAFELQVWTLSKNFVLEVIREAISRHSCEDTAPQTLTVSRSSRKIGVGRKRDGASDFERQGL